MQLWAAPVLGHFQKSREVNECRTMLDLPTP
jgi:hypothetical protein